MPVANRRGRCTAHPTGGPVQKEVHLRGGEGQGTEVTVTVPKACKSHLSCRGGAEAGLGARASVATNPGGDRPCSHKTSLSSRHTRRQQEGGTSYTWEATNCPRWPFTPSGVGLGQGELTAWENTSSFTSPGQPRTGVRVAVSPHVTRAFPKGLCVCGVEGGFKRSFITYRSQSQPGSEPGQNPGVQAQH